jgi:Na+-transporting NADH:ubiquinone oxidoreductase subunit NqrB
MVNMPWYYHFVVGGWAFGMVFMATDPVSSAFTRDGQAHLRRTLIGVLVRADPMRQPRLPGGDDARDPVHEHVRAAHRPLHHRSQQASEGCSLCRA